MNVSVRLKRAIKFGFGVDARIYEEGVLNPPLPVEIVDEMKAGNPYIIPLNESGQAVAKHYDYVSEPEIKTPDMSKFKTTATTVVKPDVGNTDEIEKPKPKLVKRAKLVRRRKNQ